jgi:hypothetical protein
MAKAQLPSEEDFPSNSILKKEDPEVRPSKRLVKGKVMRKKQSELSKITSSFFGEDLSTIMRSVVEEILLPTIKTMLSETVSTAIDMALFGESRTRRGSSNRTGSSISYGKFYQNVASGKNDRTSRRPGKRVEDIILEDRGEAKDVIEALTDILDEYGQVKVADLYELVGFEGRPSDNAYGWDNLSKAEVRRVNGGFLLDLPKPVELD